MFSYPDSQRYRLGPNYQQLPPNKPLAPVYSPYERDGPGRIDGNYGADPNYVRSEVRPVAFSKRHQFPLHEIWQGSVTARSTNLTDRDFEQPRELWKIMQQDGTSDQFVDNIRPMLGGVEEKLRKQIFGKCCLVPLFHEDYRPADTQTAYFGRVDKGLEELLEKDFRKTSDSA
jgi:catalase